MRQHTPDCGILATPRDLAADAVISDPHPQLSTEAKLLRILIRLLKRRSAEIADDNAAWLRSVGL